jgi:two-component sensor histidine kinase
VASGDLSARSEVPYDLYEIGRLAQVFDGMATTLGDDKAQLESLVDQRETLIRELNHRVKNNMQIVLSMMRGAGADSSDPKVRERIASLAGRIENLAQIHELLYQRYDTDVPPLASYVRELGTLLGEFYGEEVSPAEITGVDDIKLDIGQCISFGIILNELVANAHKHAFAGEARGTISVKVAGEESETGGQVHLIVSDNGKGVPDGFEFDDATSTGSRLMRGLTRQLQGEIWVQRLQPGTAIHVSFPAAE